MSNLLNNFFYCITGQHAERLLKEYGEHGDFIARFSGSHPLNYSLSVLQGDAVTHITVYNIDNRKFNLEGGAVFDTMNNLVLHYIKYPEKLQLRGSNCYIEIKRPLKVPKHESAYQEGRSNFNHRWFHSYMSGEEAILLLRHEKVWTFVVRDSVRAPGKYAITVKTPDDIAQILIDRNNANGKFRVCGGDEYLSLSELIEHHMVHPLVEEKTQRVLYLHYFIVATSFMADEIEKRRLLLSQTVPQTEVNGYQHEFARLEDLDESMKTKREGRRDVNLNKNRYRNIVAFDHTRVVLSESAEPKEPRETDYINANYIHAPSELKHEIPRTYISTQGCMENTLVDFWRLVWQEDIRLIIMTTKVMERTVSKCFRYWPLEGKEQIINGYYCKCVEQRGVIDPETRYDVYVYRRFMISRCGAPQRELHHFQFCAWPDHGCPDNPNHFLRFMNVVSDMHKKLPPPFVKGGTRPTLVHCSAGIGRSGCLIAIDMLTSWVKNRGIVTVIDVYKIVKALREDRSGMVQTREQYEFVYKAIASLVASLDARDEVAARAKAALAAKDESSSAEEDDQPAELAPPLDNVFLGS